MRQSRAWDQGHCCSAGTWTNVSLSNKIQRNYKGLKITACMHSWGKLWTTRYKTDQKAQLLLLKSQEQKQGVGSKSRVLSMSPALSATKGVGKPPKPPLPPDSWTRPYPHPIRGTRSPHLREQAWEIVTRFLSPLLQPGSQ